MAYNRDNQKPQPDKPHVMTTRNCLMCRVEFTSTHIGNRLCSSCKNTSDWKQGHMGGRL